MEQMVARNDFEWSYTDEPHATRRRIMLEKYPQIKKLMGPDSSLKWKVTFLVLFQISTLPIIKNLNWMSLIVLAYFFGGVINHALNLAIHEISHNLAFGHSHIWKNRALGIFANLPIGIPTSVTFKKYHLLHHRYQGDVELDMDIPTKLEARLFCTRMTKLIWLLLQPCTYSIRPLFVLPMSITLWELINAFFCLTFDYFVVALWGWKPLIYLFAGTLLTMGAHPVAGHFISEHFLLDKEHETYSYYGILNWVTFNVGYHVEHHDFPYIPGSRLPMLRKIAPEFYENWPHHTSWVKVLYNFVMRPDMGPFARICRKRSDVQQCSACGSNKHAQEWNQESKN